MIRIVVTFLVVLQAIVPPGACLCQFVPCEFTPRPAKESAPAPPPAITTAEPCCSCAARRSAPRASAPALIGDRPATGREAPPSTPAAPCSGCPVVSAGPESRVAILPAPEEVLPEDAVHFLVRSGEAPPQQSGRHERRVVPPTTPLFLRHCAFLI